MKIILTEKELNEIQAELNLLPIMATAQAQKIVTILNQNIQKDEKPESKTK